jgi:hypothetical protein
MNRILRIQTDRWVTGRAIRWAVEGARRYPIMPDVDTERVAYSHAGTDYRLMALAPTCPAIVITIERDNEVAD